MELLGLVLFVLIFLAVMFDTADNEMRSDEITTYLRGEYKSEFLSEEGLSALKWN